MGGKASILLVLGFSLIFLVIGHNFGNVSNRSLENFTDYYKESMAHNIALSGANMAGNLVFLDPTWTSGFTNLGFNDGTINVSVQVIDAYQNIKQITSVGEYEGVSKTV